MIELNQAMQDCIIEANDNNPDLDFMETIIEAMRMYVNLVGEPIQMEDEEEGEEFLNRAVTFLIDCVLFNLVNKGMVEVVGIEEGEFVYKLATY
jgi:hypothetical protein